MTALPRLNSFANTIRATLFSDRWLNSRPSLRIVDRGSSRRLDGFLSDSCPVEKDLRRRADMGHQRRATQEWSRSHQARPKRLCNDHADQHGSGFNGIADGDQPALLQRGKDIGDQFIQRPRPRRIIGARYSDGDRLAGGVAAAFAAAVTARTDSDRGSSSGSSACELHLARYTPAGEAC